MSAAVRILARWLPSGSASAAAILAAVVLVQQAIRMGANDPQLQLASDGVRALEGGMPVEAIVPVQRVDPSASLAPFVIVFDEAHKPLASSATLDGSIPVPPSGVFDAAKEQHQNVLTWQPRRDVRIASVMVHAAGAHAGFVLAGRPMRVIEERKDQVFQLGMLAIAFTWAGTVIAAVIADALERRAM